MNVAMNQLIKMGLTLVVCFFGANALEQIINSYITLFFNKKKKKKKK